MKMGKGSELSHLFATVFLYCFSNFMVAPAITDVSMAAICPGQDECSLAIYLTGAQQVIIGMGSLVVMPLIGNLSDTYGRKSMLTIPLGLSIFPLAILAYSRTKYFFYTHYILRTVIAMFTEGSVQFLSFAYLADSVPENGRAAVFGIMSGIASSSFVLGNFSTRFLSIPTTFQVAALMSLIAFLYMRFFLVDSKPNRGENFITEAHSLLLKKPKFPKLLLSLDDAICLLRTSPTFLKVAVVGFFINVSDVGLYASLNFFLKAKFHFNKDQFADIMVIFGVSGSISQLLVMPMLSSILPEEKLLSLGLFFTSVHMILYSVAWAPWVAYVSAVIPILSTLAFPCLRSIASKQAGPNEQGKVQGCITGISSFASIVSPLAFSPLAAVFLSDKAPFHFPGFTLFCAGLAAMLAFMQSLMIESSPSLTQSSAVERLV